MSTIKVYENQGQKLQEIALPESLGVKKEGLFWIDLLCPTPEEISQIERLLAIQLPTLQEVQEIESSSRLYHEEGALFMTIMGVSKESGHKMDHLTFILKEKVLVTMRYEPLSSLISLSEFAKSKITFPLNDPVSLLLGLMERIIERIADNFEMMSTAIEEVSARIFIEAKEAKKRDLRKLLLALGVQGEITSKSRESLSTVIRMIAYLRYNISSKDEKTFDHRLQTLALDADDLKDHNGFLAHKINFILDATLGFINVEQNNIVKIFSIAAVVLLPPTLVAAIYGMNFRFIPELEWRWGYPFALLLILISAILPYLYIKRKGWL